MIKKLHIFWVYSNSVMAKPLSFNHRMYNLFTKFVKIFEICKQYSKKLSMNMVISPCSGSVPKFSDLEVIALSLKVETESIDSEKELF